MSNNFTSGCVLYLLAFALELWWIIESEVSLPLPAYLLCAMYMVILLVSIFLAVGLAGKKTRVLLAWVFIMAVFYFIEGALVLYMIITHWTVQEKYGIIELAFWILRAIYNIFAYITIFSQYITWKDEKQVMMRLQHLSMSSGGGRVVATDSVSTMKKDSLHSNGHVALDGHHAYDNPAYTTTSSDLTLNGTSTGVATVTMGYTTDGRMKRSLSSASQLRLQRAPSLYGGSLPNHGQELNDPSTKHHTLNPLAMAYGGSTQSEFDASSFSGIFPFPARSQSELSLNLQSRTKANPRESILGHKPRSLMYLDEDDYLARPPPSRPVSMGYVNVHREFSTQSLDRSKNQKNNSPRRAASMEALDVRELPDVKLQKLAMKPFDYLNRPGSKPSDLDTDSDDVRKIQDVAL